MLFWSLKIICESAWPFRPQPPTLYYNVWPLGPNQRMTAWPWLCWDKKERLLVFFRLLLQLLQKCSWYDLCCVHYYHCLIKGCWALTQKKKPLVEEGTSSICCVTNILSTNLLRHHVWWHLANETNIDMFSKLGNQITMMDNWTCSLATSPIMQGPF